jgi:hypothetical protein
MYLRRLSNDGFFIQMWRSKFNRRVYCRTDLPVGVATIQVGEEFTDHAFMSMSQLKNQAFERRYLFVIKCYNSVNVAKQPEVPKEKEVLYLPGSRFVITTDKFYKTTVDGRSCVENTTRIFKTSQDHLVRIPAAL